jgi:hypothetical protein
MQWLKPKDEHIVHEALSALADGRFELIDENNAKCTSTSQGKFYSVKYDPKTHSIMSNDNMAYYRDEISYPMVAMLLKKGEIEFDQEILVYLKNIKWKDINQKNKNDYMKSVNEVLGYLEAQGVDIELISNEVDRIFEFIMKLNLNKLGDKVPPPNAY